MCVVRSTCVRVCVCVGSCVYVYPWLCVSVIGLAFYSESTLCYLYVYACVYVFRCMCLDRRLSVSVSVCVV